MTYERFEWLEIPDERTQQKKKTSGPEEALIGKRCPECGWLDEETATRCFRCGYRYNIDHAMAERIGQLGVTLPPRVIEADQNLENFFRTHGRARQPVTLPHYQLRLQAEALRLSRGFDRLICLDEIAVEHYEHQLEASLRALREMRGRALLADEVGLGKTIEAGIIMKELVQRGLVRSVLVLTPASLTEQWREELLNKFHEAFTVMEQPAEWEAVNEAAGGRWIVSLDRAKLARHRDTILAREYDLLIVDEAHKLKNRSTQAWQFVNQVRKRYVLMLTATPVQNDLMELYSLITILAPGQLGTVRAFRRHFLDTYDARQPRNASSLRRLLNDVMIRNRRSKVNIQFPRRRAAIYHLELSEAEWTLYRAVTEYIRRRFNDTDSTKHLRLTLLTLQKELSSSPQALAATLRKMLADRSHGPRVHEELENFLALAGTIPQSRKLTAVHEILDRFPGKFLIFTEYRQTQESILEALAARGIVAVSFHGGLDIRQKELAVQRFREEPDVRVLVSTESGAEGRNLQFCHQLINYDLPWNPMRVEQRIGRLHRLGQAHDVTIFNLSCNETIEAHVLDLLARKIRMFELVIGELDMILGNVDGAKSFEDLLREAWEAAGSEEDLRQRIDRLGDVLVHARRDYDRVREANELLDWALDGQ
ncbi:MAG: DEAD/DEAH box helicase family protein [Caldilinea sp.]|nr:DEAD/DEAH box helicase family protein [Caldilineaceae bacterium]MCB9120249.1 DEAD/DEAH box helicase family protein [Caldilineaceae bacterium]MCB9124081.1 DEAD/DEAH box helicase family protein [Caldilineaceae bacterium]MCW5840701.1 DEAD/DEAH box helicase family protein [Caldilinea sp.]